MKILQTTYLPPSPQIIIANIKGMGAGDCGDLVNGG